ncbi:MAG: ABC transporter permease [Saprospiraceae bacterium]|nr:ABC transporter permease [Saprospiraceae bacterium]
MSSFRQIYLTLAWRNIWRNKKRTLITMGSVVFAVVLAVLLNSVKEGILVKMQENSVNYFSGAIQIQNPEYWDEKTLENSFEFHDSLGQQVISHTGVSKFTTRLESFVLAASDSLTKGALILGIDPQKESKLTKLEDKLVAGTYFGKDDKSVILSSGLAEYLTLEVSDTLVILGQGYHGVSAAGKYPICGLVKHASPELNKQVLYLPLEETQHLFGAYDRCTSMVLGIDNINKAEQIAKELQSNIQGVAVMDWKTLLPELNQMLESERAESAIFLVILYMLISFGIFGTILMMLMERQYEFGVLVATGMRRLKLSGIVVMENIFISVLGAIIGTLLSIPAVLYFHKFPVKLGGDLRDAYENFGFEPIFYFSIEPHIFYSQTVVVFFIALALSFYPIIKLLNLDPIKAMRN